MSFADTLVWMVFAFFSEDSSRDKNENNDMQMKHMMDSFEAQNERIMAKRKETKGNGTKMNLKK